MSAQLTFFKVDNGDMALIKLDSGRSILIDINIRVAADDDGDETPDVAGILRDRLDRDDSGRLYVDAFLLSHPDEDHCLGLQRHFHLGPPEEWQEQDDKILIRELWSSPIVFRRASKNHTLCSDAKAFNAEARRRVAVFRDMAVCTDGDRILILGEDEDGKTDDLAAILVRVDENFNKICGMSDGTVDIKLLAPLPSDDEDAENVLIKNHSSTVLQFRIGTRDVSDACYYLAGGDAEVAIWEQLWNRHLGHPNWLEYDVLLAPHHCSWHSLSYDSWSEKKEDAKVNSDAKQALSNGKSGAIIVASSKPIKDDDNDPPCIRAKREYESIVAKFNGEFDCVGEHNATLEIEITSSGPKKGPSPKRKMSLITSGAIGSQPLGHGV